MSFGDMSPDPPPEMPPEPPAPLPLLPLLPAAPAAAPAPPPPFELAPPPLAESCPPGPSLFCVVLAGPAQAAAPSATAPATATRAFHENHRPDRYGLISTRLLGGASVS